MEGFMLRLRDIMTEDVATVSPETTLRDAMEIITARHISGLPVLAGNSVVGVVTATDLLAFAGSDAIAARVRPRETEWVEWDSLSEDEDAELDDVNPGAFFTEAWDDPDDGDVSARIGGTDGLTANALDEHTVGELMTRDLWALPSDSDARAAAELMRKHGIHRVLVVDNGILVGIVSSLDIAKAAADKRFTTRAYLFNRETEFGRDE